MRLSQKLKDANKQIVYLKTKYNQDRQILQVKLDKAEEDLEIVKSKNNKLSNKLIKAICSIKMSLFNYNLNNNEIEQTIQQLSLENRVLRSQLMIQNQFSCK